MKQDPYWFFKKWGIEDNSLAQRVVELEERVKYLELERVSLINDLYELENRLQAQIDKHHPPVYNLDTYSLGDK